MAAQRSLAMVLEKSGQLDEALPVTELLKRARGPPSRWATRPSVSTQPAQDAVNILRKAVEIDPDQPEALTVWGRRWIKSMNGPGEAAQTIESSRISRRP